MSTVKIDRRHVIAARNLLQMTQADLASAAGIATESVTNLETGKTKPFQSTLDKIRDALERRGIEFMNGDSPGVRLHGDRAVIPV